MSEWCSLVLKQHLIKFKTVVEGIIEKDKDLIIRAIALDPLIKSINTAKLILNDYLNECKNFTCLLHFSKVLPLTSLEYHIILLILRGNHHRPRRNDARN